MVPGAPKPILEIDYTAPGTNQLCFLMADVNTPPRARAAGMKELPPAPPMQVQAVTDRWMRDMASLRDYMMPTKQKVCILGLAALNHYMACQESARMLPYINADTAAKKAIAWKKFIADLDDEGARAHTHDHASSIHVSIQCIIHCPLSSISTMLSMI